jgi:hypothetical protein
MPRIDARQHELYAQAEAEGQQRDFRTMVGVLWRPAAEYIGHGASERAWLRIAAELGTRPETALGDLSDSVSATAWKAATEILEHLQRDDVTLDFARQRLWASAQAVMHLIAGRARLEDALRRRRDAPPLNLFVADLLDTTCAALRAPISDETRSALLEAHIESASSLPERSP